MCAAARRVAQLPAKGSRIVILVFLAIWATLHRVNDAIGHNGVVVTHIRVLGANTDVCVQ